MKATIRLPDDLMMRARKIAQREGSTLSAIVEQGLRLVVARDIKPHRKENRMPPISSATGGLMPGIDPIKFCRLDDD
jgi:hypothetical protein